jgi:signal transduction histidine kinase
LLFVAAAWSTGYEISTYRRSRVMGVGFLVCVLVAILVTGLAYQEGSSSLPLPQRWLHLVATVLFLLAAARFWRSAQVSHRIWYVWIALSLSIAAFAQVEYAFHPFQVGVIQPGDVLRFVFFVAVLLALAAEWSQNYRHLRWQTRELEALHALMTAPTVHDMNAVIQHIVRVVGETLNAGARVVVADSDQRYMRDPLTAQLIRLENDPTVKQDSSKGVVVGFDEGEGSQVVLGVPLETAERRLGMLLIMRSAHEAFSGRDVHLLRAFGAQASVLLERSMLYEEIAAGAVLEERARLAREIHDGLAQHLAFLKMRIAWLQRARDALDDAQLRDIESVLETALIEARHAITTLRARPIGTSTPEAIAGYAEEFGQVSGLEVEVQTAADTPEVGPKTAVELLRVVQEALNNVRKHAEASHVEVEMSQSGSGLRVRILDNGRGFTTGGALQGHFGLEIMRERTESLGGTLTITSTPGQGSQVDVWVPSRDFEAAEELPA